MRGRCNRGRPRQASLKPTSVVVLTKRTPSQKANGINESVSTVIPARRLATPQFLQNKATAGAPMIASRKV